jgi:hypothetical protein
MERYAIDAAIRYVESFAPRGQFSLSAHAECHSSGKMFVFVDCTRIAPGPAKKLPLPITLIVDPDSLKVRHMFPMPPEFFD